jgi:hypothetical protein
MSKIPLIIAAMVACADACAQTEKIDTDRPDQTESAAIVPDHYFQAEFGFNKENSRSADYDLVHPTALLKYGFKRWELRVEATARSSYMQLIPEPKWTRGLEPVELGFKAALLEERGIRPKTSLIVHLGLPFLATKSFHIDHVAPTMRLVLQKNITQWMGVGVNLGATWDGLVSYPAWLYTVSPGFSFGRWYAYVEAFGFIQKNEAANHSADAGLAYYISDDVKVDVSGGLGLSHSAPKNYGAVGFSFRVNTRKSR